MSGQLVILDRDGVINHDSDDFIKSVDEWQEIAGSAEAIGRLTAAGFKVAVATNQSGVGRKLIDRPVLNLIHDRMRQVVRRHGGDIDRIVYCPHHPNDHCACRKPLPGLLNDLARHYGVSLEGVPVIGDSLRDLQAALAVGARPLLVLTGNGRRTASSLDRLSVSVEIFHDLAAAADALIQEQAAVL